MSKSLTNITLTVLVTLGLLVATTAVADSSSHRYKALKTTEAIHVDGKLDEVVWEKAQAVNLSVKNGGETKQATTVRMLWDDYYLYFSWDCEDSHVWSTMTVRDQPLYNEEVVEVFIDADSDRFGYVELEINPLGTFWDGFILNHGLNDEGHVKLTGILAWNSKDIRWAAWPRGTVGDSSDTDQGWSAEMAVPLKDMVTAPHNPPRDGDKWLVNFYRIDLPHGAGHKGEGQAWSPVSGTTFHDPEQFGQLIFSTELVP
jgi:hypothetical protein